MRIMVLALLAATAPNPAQQAAAPPTAEAVDPERLAAARALIDVIMPPATREQLIVGMMMPMMANLRRGFSDNPQFATSMGSDPRVKAMFDEFMAQQETRSTTLMREALPGMFPAMANAYARRFDLRQLRDIRTFFETPSGRAYMAAAFTIMSDPDVAAWQRDVMARSMATMQQEVTAFAQKVAALPPRRTK